MSATNFNTYREIVVQREKLLERLLRNGEYDPFLLHHFFILLFLPIIALSIPHKNALSRSSRYIFFLLTLGLGAYVIRCTRAMIVGNGYSVGLATTWWVVWSGVTLVIDDPQKDFKRIERRSVPVNDRDMQRPKLALESPHMDAKTKSKSKSKAKGKSISKDSLVRHRRPPASRDTPLKTGTQFIEVLKWQSYPETLSHRLDWVVSLVLSFRGPEWNWRIPTVTPLPKAVLDQLEGKTSDVRASQLVDLRESRKCLKKAIFNFLTAYIALDIIKVIMMRDRYFWGFVSDTTPPLFPFGILASWPFLLHIYRLFFSGIGILFAMEYATALNPIIFLGLSLAFPTASRAVTNVPLDAAWLYPDQFGPFITSILDHGIAGCWGIWWHQLFRFPFWEPARWLSSFLPERLRHDGARRPIYLIVPFTISGLLHTFGSQCQIAATKPWTAQFPFFILQSIGIGIQRFLAKQVLPNVLPFKPPRWLRRATNVTVIILWFYFTGPNVTDDFAVGGMWLVEPVPISIVRGLGFGAEGEGWWCFPGHWFEWWSGKTWWQSGIRFV